MSTYSQPRSALSQRRSMGENYLQALLNSPGSTGMDSVTVTRTSLQSAASRTQCGEIQFAEQGQVERTKYGKFSLWLIEPTPESRSDAPWPPPNFTDPLPQAFVAAIGAGYSAKLSWQGKWSGFFVTFNKDLLAEIMPPAVRLSDLNRDWAHALLHSHDDLVLAMKAIREALRSSHLRDAGEFRDALAGSVVRQYFLRSRELSLYQDDSNNPLVESRSTALRLAMEYIDENLSARLNLSEIAAVIGVTPWHFSRTFKRATGLTPYQYIVKRRIDRAKQLLSQSHSLSLSELALSLGFYDHSQFCMMFKRHTGITPKTYSKRIHWNG